MHWYHFNKQLSVYSSSYDRLRGKQTGRRLFMLTLGGIAAGFVQRHPPASAMAAANQCYVIETKNGLLTATFGDMADDAALTEAVPDLIAKGVQSVVLRNLPVEDLNLL